MYRTQVTQTLEPVGFAPAGKPAYTNGRARVMALAILCLSAPWAAFSQAAPAFTVLYTFTGGADGSGNAGIASVSLDKAGNIYGTTVAGGDLSACSLYGGCGVVYKLDPAGSE